MTFRIRARRPLHGRGRRLGLALGTAVLAGAMTGCSSTGEADVQDVVAAFYSAVAQGHGEAACALLASATRDELEQASGRPCGQAILEEALPQPSEPHDVALFGSAAQVGFGSETTFLSRFPDGWRVVAAGCTPNRPEPYDCLLTKG